MRDHSKRIDRLERSGRPDLPEIVLECADGSPPTVLRMNCGDPFADLDPRMESARLGERARRGLP